MPFQFILKELSYSNADGEFMYSKTLMKQLTVKIIKQDSHVELDQDVTDGKKKKIDNMKMFKTKSTTQK